MDCENRRWKQEGIALLLSLLLPACLFSTTIRGSVQNQMTKANISDALLILIKPDDRSFLESTVSDEKGQFVFRDVAPGKYNIEIRREGYFNNVLFDLQVVENQDYLVRVRLLAQEEGSDSDYNFMLGGIEVEAEQSNLIPEEIATTRKISSGEIEHLQAASLGDILSLIPGVEKNTTPGLSKPVRVGLRSVMTGGASIPGIESFGTAIIVDGNDQSNDINAKQKGVTGTTGIDLRGIPADNIKSVEVITGIPSVEYGNFAQGIIKVETKIGVASPKMKVKISPETRGASFSFGHKLWNSIFDYYLNYGFSERDRREEGDNYHRISLGGNISRDFLDDRLHLKLRSNYMQQIDSEEPVGEEKMKDFNLGYRATGSISMEYDLGEGDKLLYSTNVNLDNKQYFKERWLNEQIMVGDSIVFGYVGKLEEIGKEWDIAGRLQSKISTSTGKLDHQLLFGLDFDYEKNNGPGLLVDSLYNYYGAYSKKRSYSFDEFPAYRSISVYFEDVISGLILARKYQLMCGLRYDVFNPIGFNWGHILEEKTLVNSDYGEFLSPRVNIRYFISDDFRIRIGAGKSAKRVSLAHIYRAPAYAKFLRDGVVVEESYAQINPHLQAYTTSKYEVSVDWRPIDLIGLSLTGYYSETTIRPSSASYPWGYDLNPDTLTSLSYSIYENHGWNHASGIEFTSKTKRIRNLQHRFNLTYRFTESGRTGRIYDSSPDTTWEEIWYPPSSKWCEKVIMDNQLSFISQRLGIWLTVETQNVMIERKQDEYHSASTIKEVEELGGEERVFYQGMSYWYSNELYDYGNYWILNFRLTKSISSTTEISLYVNNILDDRARWYNPFTSSYSYFNPSIYYGMEVSTQW